MIQGTTGVPGVDRAIAILKANGYTVDFSIVGGYTVVDIAKTRTDGVTSLELIDMAKQYEPKTDQPQ